MKSGGRAWLTLNKHVLSGEAKCLYGEWDLAQLYIWHDARGMRKIHTVFPSAAFSSAYDLYQEDALSPKQFYHMKSFFGVFFVFCFFLLLKWRRKPAEKLEKKTWNLGWVKNVEAIASVLNYQVWNNSLFKTCFSFFSKACPVERPSHH